MERLNFENKRYSDIESAIHLNRYHLIKDICKGKRVLDIACGEGYGSKLISDWGAKEVVGVDISEEALTVAKQNFQSSNIKFLLSDANKLSTKIKKKFDLIVSLETIEHINNPESFLKNLKNLSDDNTTFVITCPNDYFYYPNETEGNKYHLKKYKFVDFKELAERILGNNVKYMIGTYAGGYINKNLLKSENKKSQKEIFNYNVIESLLIPSNEDLDFDKSCYYIGVWNGNISESATIYAYNDLLASNKKLIDENFKLENIVNNMNKEVTYYFEEINSYKDILNKEMTNYFEKINRYENILEILEEENKILKSNLSAFYNQDNNFKIKKLYFKFRRFCGRIYRYIKKKIN